MLMTIGSARFLYGFEKRGNFEVQVVIIFLYFDFRLCKLDIFDYLLNRMLEFRSLCPSPFLSETTLLCETLFLSFWLN